MNNKMNIRTLIQLKDLLEYETHSKIKLINEALIPPNFRGESVYNQFKTVLRSNIFVTCDYGNAVDEIIYNFGRNIDYCLQKIDDLLGTDYVYSFEFFNPDLNEGDDFIDKRDSDVNDDPFFIPRGFPRKRLEITDEEKFEQFQNEVIFRDVTKFFTKSENINNSNISVDLESMCESFNKDDLSQYADEELGLLKLTADYTSDHKFEVTCIHSIPYRNTDLLQKLENYLLGQFSDGWGESYEQIPNEDENGVTYYLHAWNKHDNKFEVIENQ